MTLGRDCVLVADMDVLDADLQIVDDRIRETLSEALAFLLLFRADTFHISLFQQLGIFQLLHLDIMLSFAFLLFIELCILLRCSKEEDVLYSNPDRLAPQVCPRD